MSEFMNKLTRHQTAWEPLPEDSDLEQFFTDAEHAHQVFEELVTADRLPKRLLVIHGVGGVGKSTLLRMYRLSCYRRGIPVALVGAEDAPSSVDVLASWAEDLSNMGVRLRSFTKSLDHHRALQSKVEAKAEKAKETMRGAAGELGKAVAKTAVQMAASTIPVIGPLAAALGGTGTEAAIDWLRGFLSKPDLEFYLDPSKRLTDDFLSDLTRAAERQRTVLMADTYEQMTALGDWMRDLTQRLPNNVLLVIAGRVVPEWDRAWTGWMGQAKIVELKEMTLDDQRTLVRRYYAYIRGGEPDPEQVDAIVRFARGLPIAATTVVRLWVRHGVEDFHTVKAQVVADLADRLLEGVPPEMRPVFEAAAVLRYFNADSLCALLDDRDADALYAELRRWPFIRPRREGLAVHDTMREMVNEALRMRTPERFRTLHGRAAEYYETRLAKASGDKRERYALERLYHRTCADEEEGMQLFQEMAEELARYRLVNRLRALLNDTNAYSLERESNRLWREYYSARLACLEGRLDDAEKAYQAIDENDQAETKLRAYTLCNWGEVLSFYKGLLQPGGIERAIRILERSLDLAQLDSHTASSFLHLARVHRFQARWDEEASFLEKARAFFEQRGDEHGLAYVYDGMKLGPARRGLWKELFAIQEQLEDLYSRLPESTFLKSRVLGGWALSWALAGRLSESERKARESINLTRSLDYPYWLHCTLRDLGWALGFQGRYDEAEQNLSESLGIARGLGGDYNTDIGLCKGFWGAVLARQGEIDKATEYLLQSREQLQIVPARVFEPSVWLGRLCEIRQDLDGAQDYYERCLDLRWRGRNYFDSESLTGLVRVKHAQGDYFAIPSLLAEAERLAQKHEYNDHLASLRLSQGHIAWEGHIPEWGNGFDTALHYYQRAMVYALRYNRFLLDEVLWGGGIATPLRSIIPHCLARDEEGRQMLVALRNWWQRGANDIGAARPDTISPIPEGIPLLEAEHIAREREPGDGSPQVGMVERIERALKETTIS